MTSLRAAALAALATFFFMPVAAQAVEEEWNYYLLCNTSEQVLDTIGMVDEGYEEIEAAAKVNEIYGSGVCGIYPATLNWIIETENVETDHLGAVEIWQVQLTTLYNEELGLTLNVIADPPFYQYAPKQRYIPPPPPEELYEPELRPDQEDV